MNRGEIWWAESPAQKRRPYLILTRQGAIEHLNSLLAVPATRTIRGIPTELELGADDGMPADCALAFDATTLMPKIFLTERITRLGIDRMTAVCRTLRMATGCQV